MKLIYLFENPSFAVNLALGFALNYSFVKTPSFIETNSVQWPCFTVVSLTPLGGLETFFHSKFLCLVDTSCFVETNIFIENSSLTESPDFTEL